MMSRIKAMAAAAAFALMALPAAAATVAVGGTGSAGAGGFTSDIATTDTGHPAYNNDPTTPASGWVWAADGGFSEYGSITFTFDFDLTGFDVSTASLGGLWGVDNAGTIALNGTPFAALAFSFEAFQVQNPFAYAGAAFVQGMNHLVFTTSNAGGPGAFRASVTVEASAVPVPAALPLLAGGLLALGALARRRRPA